AGVLYAQPPSAVLAQILAVRVHLDPSPAQNGALRVIPGSHLDGRVSSSVVKAMAQSSIAITCEAVIGDLLWLRPLLVHASPKSVRPTRRRVLHIEFAPAEVVYGLPPFAAA